MDKPFTLEEMATNLFVMPLHNFQPATPIVDIEKENPKHRLVLYLKAQGFTNKAIAAEVKYDECHVGRIVRQPWFMEQLTTLLAAKGEAAIEKRLNILASEAIEIAGDLMRTTENEKIRAQCAFGLITAARGNKVVVENAASLDLAEVERRKAEVQQRIADLKGERVGSNSPERPISEPVTAGRN